MCQLLLPTLVNCHLFLWSFLWNSAVLALALLLLCSPMCGAKTCILLAAYVVPLAELYRKEAAEGRAFALARVRGLDARKLMAWVDGEPLAPLSFLLPAGLMICLSCGGFG